MGSPNGCKKGDGGIFLWEFPKKNATTIFLAPLGGTHECHIHSANTVNIM